MLRPAQGPLSAGFFRCCVPLSPPLLRRAFDVVAFRFHLRCCVALLPLLRRASPLLRRAFPLLRRAPPL
jgi:hypothetical protein